MDGIRLKVNEAEYSLAVKDDTPLLYVLRNELQLKCTKFGCGEGHCGACTVVVNGNAVQSCSVPLWSVRESDIQTLEGAGNPDAFPELARLKTLFIEEQAFQCGYCIPGIIMTIYAEVVTASEKPARQKIIETLSARNLCRCGTHMRIIRVLDRYLSETAIA